MKHGAQRQDGLSIKNGETSQKIPAWSRLRRQIRYMQHIVPIKSNISYRTKLAFPVVPVPIQGLHEDGGVLKTRGNRGVGGQHVRQERKLCVTGMFIGWAQRAECMVGLGWVHTHTRRHTHYTVQARAQTDIIRAQQGDRKPPDTWHVSVACGATKSETSAADI